MATAGLFSALAACGGSSDSSNNSSPPPVLDFDTFAQSTSFADGIRYTGGDKESSAFYLKEGQTSLTTLGTVTVANTDVNQDGITYSITGVTGYTFASGKDVTDYFSISASGELQLAGDNTLSVASADGNQFTLTIQASAEGATSDDYEVTIHLGKHVVDAAPIGGAGDDYIEGTDGDNEFDGEGGDDILRGGAGADKFWFAQSSGDDSSHDTIIDFSRAQGDTIIIRTGATAITAADALTIVANLDIADAGTLDSKITNGWDDASLTVMGLQQSRDEWLQDIWFYQIQTIASGSPTIHGSAYQDWISGSSGNDTIHGGASNDLLQGYVGNDTLHGDAGDDTLEGGANDDTLNGGADNDTLTGGDGVDTLNGGDGNDRLDGGAGVDTLTGGDGDDYLYGGAGVDTLTGGNDDDQFWFGKDGASGNLNNDTITDFNRDDDMIIIKTGVVAVTADQAWTVAGKLTIANVASSNTDSTITAKTGWTGNSLRVNLQQGTAEWANDIWFHQKQTVVSNISANLMYGSAGQDWLEGGAGLDNIDGGAGNDVMYGYAGNDDLIGGTGADIMDGGAGDDHLQGGEGNDILYAGAGTDTLWGQRGDDIMYCDAGKDAIFVQSQGSEGRDIVRGFSPGEDKIQIKYASVDGITFGRLRMTYDDDVDLSLPGSADNGSVVIKGYDAGSQIPQITLEAYGDIKWDAVTNPITSDYFDFLR